MRKEARKNEHAPYLGTTSNWAGTAARNFIWSYVLKDFPAHPGSESNLSFYRYSGEILH